MAVSALSLQDIQAAQKRIAGAVRLTPILPAEVTLADTQVFFKLENLQRTGAFKIRGATNCMAMLSAQERERGVIAASAGNHAQGVAAAAASMKVRAAIVMPEVTPWLKVHRTRALGAEVIISGRDFDEAYAAALTMAKERDLVFIHPFADERVIAGQGTIGLEILQQVPQVESLVVPVGGGGLIGGISLAVKQTRPDVRIFGVQTELAPAMQRFFKTGAPYAVETQPTIAEGIAVACPAESTCSLVHQYVDDIVTVSEQDIAAAMLRLLEDYKLVVEGAGATGFAALPQLAPHLGKNTVLVISGGNADVTTLGAVIDRGLAVAGRVARLRVQLRDVPGALAQFSQLLGQAQANIIEIFHNRTTGNVEIGRAEVDVVLSTRGHEHAEEVLRILAENGYEARRDD